MDRRSALTFGTAAAAMGLAVNATHAAVARKPTHGGPYIERPDGTSLFFKDWGKGDPVVFVHSAGNSSDVWAHSMIHIVKQGFRCVAFDRRGHGRSSVPGGGYDYDTLADDLAGVIDAIRSAPRHARRTFHGLRGGGALSQSAWLQARGAHRAGRAHTALPAQDA